MARVYTCLAVVVVVFSWLSNDASFAAGISCERIDVLNQILKFAEASADAQSSIDPEDLVGTEQKTTTGETLASYGFSGTATSGGSEAGINCTLTASNPSPWGTTGISEPTVSLAMVAVMSASVDSSDDMGQAGAEFYFEDSESHVCEAVGEFEANSGDSTGTFTGIMDIIIAVDDAVGDAGFSNGAWEIWCGYNYLYGELASDGDSWNVTGGIYVDDVWEDLSGSYPLDINMVLNPTQSVDIEYEFTLEIAVWNFEVYAYADDSISNSSLLPSLSFSSSASVQGD